MRLYCSSLTLMRHPANKQTNKQEGIFYYSLLLQDFSRYLMLISKKPESCWLAMPAAYKGLLGLARAAAGAGGGRRRRARGRDGRGCAGPAGVGAQRTAPQSRLGAGGESSAEGRRGQESDAARPSPSASGLASHSLRAARPAARRGGPGQVRPRGGTHLRGGAPTRADGLRPARGPGAAAPGSPGLAWLRGQKRPRRAASPWVCPRRAHGRAALRPWVWWR